MTATYNGRPLVLIKRAAIYHQGRTRRLPLVSLPMRPDALRERTRDACGRLRSPATMPGYHKGRVPANKGKTYPPTPLTPEEAMRMVDRFPMTNPTGCRNRALFVLLWRSGLRVHEALLLKPGDVDMDAGTIFVRRGKGGKSSYSGIDEFGRAELARWLAIRARRGHTEQEPIFCVTSGPTRGRAVGAASVRTYFHQIAERAGIDKRVAPHQLRHAHACDLAREGVILPHISRQLGHAHPGITGLYLSGLPAAEAVAVVAARPAPMQIAATSTGGEV